MPESRLASPAALEEAAHLLEASSDYRVLRRLVPQQEFRAATGAPTQRAIVLDTETTGTDPETDRVIELGLLAFDYVPDTGEVLRVAGVYDALEDPGMPIPAEVTAIHGITDEMVRGQRIDDAAVAAFVAGASWVVAHNARFDRQFIESRLPVFQTLRWLCSYAEIPWKQEGFAGAKLDYLVAQHGFFFDGHRSEIDCRALLEVLRRPLLKSGQIAWQRLLESGPQLTYRISALEAPFDSKDLLKARGYRWDAKRRCWHRTLGREEAAAEAPWLKERVYGGKSREVEIEVQDALVRYSGRQGRLVTRSL